jgi:hypothetical protein
MKSNVVRTRALSLAVTGVAVVGALIALRPPTATGP